MLSKVWITRKVYDRAVLKATEQSVTLLHHRWYWQKLYSFAAGNSLSSKGTQLLAGKQRLESSCQANNDPFPLYFHQTKLAGDMEESTLPHVVGSTWLSERVYLYGKS